MPSVKASSLLGVVPRRNRLMNATFAVNQRGVASPVTLAAGAYGHDRWKAGAGGCTYSWATVNGLTTITITAGSLVQVIEGSNLDDGAANTYVLWWTGTAQGKIGAGAASASGVTGAADGGTNLNIEFGLGTLAKPQLEPGAVRSMFERRPYGMELALCQRYAQPFPSFLIGQAYSTATAFYAYGTGIQMRATPTISAGTYTTTNALGANVNIGTFVVNTMIGTVIRFDASAVAGAPLVAGNATMLSPPAGAMLTAEL